MVIAGRGFSLSVTSFRERRQKKQRKKKVVAKAGTEDVGELTCGESLTVERNIHFHKFQTTKL